MTVLLIILAVAVLLHVATCALAAWRYLFPSRAQPVARGPKVSLLRPVCGADPFDAETLASSFGQDYRDHEIIFCAAHKNDPAVAVVQRLMQQHPEAPATLLIGEDLITGNPKVNNLAKGYHAAASDLILMTDSNLLLPRSYVTELMGQWRDGIGAVSGPAAGIRPDNFWASVECAFLNTLQGRWQLAADQVGYGFAQGKTLFIARQTLEAGGGLPALGRLLAEDAALTHLVRAQDLKVKLPPRLYAQPIGLRSLSAMWGRQMRWSQIRRDGFLPLFLAEIAQGPLVPVLLTLTAILTGAWPAWTLPALLALWYGTEWTLACIAGWPASPRDVVAYVVRDVLTPVIWASTWARKSFEWRGNAVTAGPEAPHP
ncbi:glycosyltransferase [Donghicola tyrosinivorans]|uniref:Ceramide glucosyltransferase n=1 Tax=Donghicola tyrosinivorans TaxID=1652492 RepID=A0A2T0WU63_9RHOB|nr:glycosyltransferase [Donghicola tyrosinivorans]PRY90235.1 ceramide glucosyltransferase [Donghicola tyrosinivorans]